MTCPRPEACFSTNVLVLGRSDEALEAYRHALRLAPSMIEALVNIGVELFKLNRPGEALATLQRAVQAGPNSAVANHNLGVVLTWTLSSGLAWRRHADNSRREDEDEA